MEQDAPPVPSRQAQDDGPVDGWARDGTETSPCGSPAECPEAVDPPPCRRLRGHVSAAASVCATLNYGSVERSPGTTPDACSRDHNHCVHKKVAWIGDMYFSLGSNGQSLSICINYRGSQVHMDRTMIKCILVL